MKDLILPDAIRSKINKRVDRILNDLGNPEPPLKLPEVRRLLELDLGYYRTDDDGFLRKVAHKLLVAGKQVIDRPGLLFDVVTRCGIKALWLPDPRRILIDDTLPKPKHRWAEAHEIVHGVLEWHEPVMRGDSELTLHHDCLEKIEAEANYGAGQLTFLRSRFDTEALDSAPSVKLVMNLSDTFANTKASTLWRVVETLGREKPLLGIIHYHPNPRLSAAKFDPRNPCRHFIQSAAFASQFSQVSESAVFDLICSYIEHRSGGPLGKRILPLTDDNGDGHEFVFETFSLRHQCITLCVHHQRRPLVVGV